MTDSLFAVYLPMPPEFTAQAHLPWTALLFGYHRGLIDVAGVVAAILSDRPDGAPETIFKSIESGATLDEVAELLHDMPADRLSADRLRAPELVGLATEVGGELERLRRPWDPLVLRWLLTRLGQTQSLLEAIEWYYGAMGYPTSLEDYLYFLPAPRGDEPGLPALFRRIERAAAQGGGPREDQA